MDQSSEEVGANVVMMNFGLFNLIEEYMWQRWIVELFSKVPELWQQQ